MKIYIVVYENWSTFEIWGFYSTLERAKERADLVNRDNNREQKVEVQEFELDTDMIPL